MGALHDGHRKLIREGNAIKGNKGTLIVSIYLNPIQFNDPKDLDEYPRTFDTDYKVCEEEDVDLIFAPSDAEMYLNSSSVKVSENKIARELCGSKRPGHFDGVCTVVTKLFNLIKPKIAIFGKKDYQQLSIIRQLVTDLNYSIEIIAIEERAPVRPSSKVLNIAKGKFATIPANIIIDIPLPKPCSVICSPSHIKNIVPEVIVIIADI